MSTLYFWILVPFKYFHLVCIHQLRPKTAVFRTTLLSKAVKAAVFQEVVQ